MGEQKTGRDVTMKRETKRRFNRAISAAVGAALCLSFFIIPGRGFNVNATSSSIEQKKDKIKELEERNKQIENSIASMENDIDQSEKKQELYLEKLNTVQAQLDNYNNLLYYMEEDIAAKQANIEALDLHISAKEDEITQKENEIKKLNSENEANLNRFGEVLHAMYVTENTDIFSVLAESTDIYDLLVRTKMMINVSKQNEEMMQSLKESIANTEKIKQQLEEDKTDLQSSRLKVVEEKEALESDKAQLIVKQQEAAQLSNEYSSAYTQYSKEISDIVNKQQQLQNEKKANAAEIAAYQQQIDREIQLAQQGSNQVYQQGEWIWPLETQFTMITTYFGYDDWRNGNHSGIDISGGGIYGHPIYASKAGTVIIAKTTYIEGYSYGKYVVIDHGDGYSTLYGHCSDVYVSVGQQVERGETVAAVGSTGWSTGPHLHFEVRVNNIPQNPFDYVKKFW